VTDAERIATLRRAGFRRSVIAALLGVTVAQVQQVIEDPANAPSLQLVGALPDVQSALTNGALTVPASPPGIVAHDYVSNGDTNGIFYALGTLGGPFSNPAVDGPVVVTESSILVPWDPPPHATYLTDRDSTVNIFQTAGPAVGWAMWDFGTARAVKLRDYTVRSRWDANTLHPTAFQLQGSNDGATWDVLDDASPGFTGVDQWRHFACDVVPDNPYRYIRLIDYADGYLILGEVELYGDLYTY
jgi:hypothetical protein